MFFLFPPFLSRKSNARTREPAWLEKKSFDRTRHFQRNLPEIEEKWFSSRSIGGNNRTSSGFTCLAFDNLPQSLSLPLLDRILFEHDPIERAHQYQIAHTSPPKTLSSQKRSISFVYLFYRAVLYIFKLNFSVQGLMKSPNNILHINLFAIMTYLYFRRADTFPSVSTFLSFFSLARTWPTSSRSKSSLPPSKLQASSWTLLAPMLLALMIFMRR